MCFSFGGTGEFCKCKSALVLISPLFRLIFPSKFSTRPREDTENPLVKILAQKCAKIAHNTAPALALQDSTNILL
jgi:hypothetical protein